jgi:uncharacterized protein YbaR (Trm112 family)
MVNLGGKTKNEASFVVHSVSIIASQGGSMTISKDLLDILACPKCKGDIYLNESGDGLICNVCRLMYPIKDDIPVMLIDEATRI